MNCCMIFPDSVEEFMEEYKMVDTKHIYSNGTEYVPIFRMKQWFEHLPSAEKTGRWNEYYRATTDDTFHCSPCGSCFIVLQGNERMNFCPNCGAKMEND